MQITLRGFRRNHGTLIVAEESLEDVPVFGKNAMPTDEPGGAILEQVTDGTTTQYFRYATHARLNLSGSYVLEIRLSPADVAKLCWLAFKDKALTTLLRVFGAYENKVIEKDRRVSERLIEIERRSSLRDGRS